MDKYARRWINGLIKKAQSIDGMDDVVSQISARCSSGDAAAITLIIADALDTTQRKRFTKLILKDAGYDE